MALAAPPPPAADGRRRSGSGAAFVAMATTASVLGLIKGLVVAKVVGIEDFGYYGLVLVVAQFGTYVATWGVLNATFIRVPQAIARGEPGIERQESEALSVLLATCAITVAVYVAALAAIPFDGAVREALLLAAVLAVGQALGEYVLLLLRVRSALDVLGRLMVVRSVGVLVVGVAAGALFGYGAVVLAELVALAITTILARRARLHTLAPRRFPIDEAKSLVRFGAPLMVAELLSAAALTVDRLFVAGAVPDDLGHYVFAAQIVTVWVAVIGILSQWLSPPLLHAYGGGSPAGEVWRTSLRITAVILAGGAAGFAALHASIWLLGDVLFAEYARALDVMPILYVGGLLGALAFPGILLQALRPSRTLAASALGALVCVAGGIALTAGDAGLEAFAWLFVASQAVTTAMTLISTRRAIASAAHDAGA
ncbi:MAG TPA: oligosaccharide flippase family protein [Solirubrobacteraceae bacterium]